MQRPACQMIALQLAAQLHRWPASHPGESSMCLLIHHCHLFYVFSKQRFVTLPLENIYHTNITAKHANVSECNPHMLANVQHIEA